MRPSASCRMWTIERAGGGDKGSRSMQRSFVARSSGRHTNGTQTSTSSKPSMEQKSSANVLNQPQRYSANDYMRHEARKQKVATHSVHTSVADSHQPHWSALTQRETPTPRASVLMSTCLRPCECSSSTDWPRPTLQDWVDTKDLPSLSESV